LTSRVNLEEGAHFRSPHKATFAEEREGDVEVEDNVCVRARCNDAN